MTLSPWSTARAGDWATMIATGRGSAMIQKKTDCAVKVGCRP
jgi:hypothetical protein